jgi:GTP cyclohydrolase I
MESNDRSLISEQKPDVSGPINELLVLIGRSGEEGTKGTPQRVAKFYSEWLTSGEPSFKLTDFDAESFDQMVMQRRIPFYSMCEHHLLPFFGLATVAYIPQGKILGLSKLARIVDWYARRPQNQERLTQQIGTCLERTLNPIGVGVSLTGRHMCMEMRGIKAFGTETTTNYLSGQFKLNPAARAEFLGAL